jgi:hypothetical protein
VGEPGLANIEVTLKDDFGTPIMTTTTDSTGHYLFTGVTPGSGYYVEVTGGLPSGLTQSSPSGHTDDRTDPISLIVSQGNNRDEFGTAAYNNSNGSENWSANPWVETDGAGGGAGGGEIQITGGELRINDDTGGAANSIYRPLSIPADATMATLSFDWRTTGVEAADTIILEISPDGTTYTTLETFTGIAGATNGSRSIDVSDYLAAGTTIRFRVSAGYTGADDFFYVDDVNVAYSAVLTTYLSADLGYRTSPGTAAIGNTVWSDANSSTTRDAGEPGLAGVSVQLWSDANSNGTFEPGSGDTLWGTATTAPDGSYLFTGVPASGTEDYFVYVDGSQAALTGYTRTTPPNDPLYLNNLSAGDVVQYANFGYNSGTTYSITDRVWLDSDGDGTQDVGESGISGITVALLDASDNIIATTATGSNGNFQFTGVSAGVRYSWKITDTAGVLTNYYGTTASALAGTFQMPGTLTGNLDYTSTPHFGYNLTRSIGDTAFNDNGTGGGTVGDGVQNGSEPGISGVTVLLYLDDGDNVFEPGTGAGRDGAPVATTTTDPNGKYLFSGLPNGTYWVSIDNTQSALSGFDTLTTADNSGVAGHQRSVALVGGVSQMGVDYGYRASTSYSASGTLWNDADNDGVLDGGEAGLAGVTIALLQGGNVIATTTTAANGTYSFSGLPSGTYAVKITDNSGVLSNFIGTYEKTEGTTGPFDGQETLDLTSGDQTADFGYANPIFPTLVQLSFFGAHERDGEVVVEWETSYERNTLGFNLLRLDAATGNYETVNTGLLPAMHRHYLGGRYSLVDRGATAGGAYHYRLIEVERNGSQNVYGPFIVSVQRQDSPRSEGTRTSMAYRSVKADSGHGSDYSRQERRHAGEEKALFLAGQKSGRSAHATLMNRSAQATGTRIKIPVREAGLYYLDADDIAALWGLSRARTVNMIEHAQLSLSNKGKQVAYLPAENNAGIFFYGTGTDSVYTGENIYWIDRGEGRTMRYEDAPTRVPATGDETFTADLHIEQDVIPNMSQTNNPAEDYWNWDLLFLSGFYSDPPKSFTFSVHGSTDTHATATLQLHLVGGSDGGTSPDHHVVVSLNSQDIGEGQWDGLNSYTLTATFDQSLLNEGENTLEVRGVLDAGVEWSMFLIDSFDLTYEKQYGTSGNRLSFTGDGNQAVTVRGFTTLSPDILVLNITNPRKPRVHVATIAGSPGDYEISMSPVSSDAPYLAIAADAAVKVANAQAVNPSNLQATSNRADYLIIVPEQLRSAVQPLADYRNAQGMRTMVVNLDDIMNEFNHGLSSPKAIRKFLTHAYKNWRKAPRYVVLAGGGTWDFRDNLGAGGNLIPPAMVATPYGLATSDNHLADVNGDHVPEMAIGRLPVLTPEELQAVISKIKAFENTAGNRAILLADHPDEGGDFTSDSEEIATLFPSTYTLQKVYLANLSFDVARTMLSTYLNGGSVFFNYIGHGSLDSLSKTGIFANTNWYPDALLVDSLSNGNGLPIMAGMTCTMGEFGVPGYLSLSQSLVLKGNGGAAAVWSPTTLSDNEEAKLLNSEFYRAFFVNGKKVLGDAVLQSFQNYKLNGTMPYMTEIYAILGDPALRIK